MSTLRLRGSHSFDSGTVYVYADGKLLTELPLESGGFSGNLRVPSNSASIGIRIKATSSSGGGGWVPPGQKKKKGRTSSAQQFDEQASIRARFEPGRSRTLEIRAGNDIELRWID